MICEACGLNHKPELVMTYPDKKLFRCNKGPKSVYFEKFSKPAKADTLSSEVLRVPPFSSESSQVAETSIKAKKEIECSGKAKTQREWICQVIKNSNNGLTISEIYDLTDLQKSSISPRVNELVKANKLYDSGRRIHKEKEGIVWKTN